MADDTCGGEGGGYLSTPLFTSLLTTVKKHPPVNALFRKTKFFIVCNLPGGLWSSNQPRYQEDMQRLVPTLKHPAIFLSSFCSCSVGKRCLHVVKGEISPRMGQDHGGGNKRIYTLKDECVQILACRKVVGLILLGLTVKWSRLVVVFK
ncbi:uncharacterized protein LOC116610363 isoform X2 [Nematostella vectensis]|uniref:uncharacterized protein LOC116610363 isoform X2 n=1 Tax=Nematostella vectensis TaxID=45351 RepID=UPI002076F89B|nr:uncharacterized protein LOC116610363 isoform X2 [Nematostella vectensis]